VGILVNAATRVLKLEGRGNAQARWFGDLIESSPSGRELLH